MPGLARSEWYDLTRDMKWYDLTRDMNWTLSYVDQEEAWPSDVSNTYGIPTENWWGWDEPYKITYTEYVHNRVGKDAGVRRQGKFLADEATVAESELAPLDVLEVVYA